MTLSDAPGDVSASALGSPPSPWTRLLTLLRPDRRDLVAVVLFALVIGVLLLATPVAVQAVVNFVAQGGALPPLIVVVGLLFFGLGVANLLQALQIWTVEILQRRLFVRAVAQLAERLPRAALGRAGRRYGPELVNRYFDLETIQKRGSFLLLNGLSLLLSVLTGLVLLAFYHPLLLAFDLLILAAILLVVLGPIRRGIASAKAESQAKYEMAAWLEEVAENPLMFKASGAGESVAERSDRLARNYLERRGAHFRIAFGQGVAALALQVLASTALLGIGGLLVIRGSLTLGQLVAAELVLTLVLTSAAKLGKHLEAFYDLMAATDKLGQLLDVPVERDGGAELEPAAQGGGARLELRAVGWEDPTTGTRLAGVDLALEPGERLGICGPSGAGKSALLRLIWGIEEPVAGSIRLDGRDIKELSLASLRRHVSLIDRIEVLDQSVRDNVTLARPDVDDAGLRRALDAVGLYDELSMLPDGLETVLAVDGSPLSAGQLARLEVARAIAARPRLLLVSDLFESLGSREREQVYNTLFEADAPWSLVFVSNSERVLGRCRRTSQLSDGRLEPFEVSGEVAR